MLKDATTNGIRKIYIACGFTDLRKGIDGLSLLIQEDFKLNPLEQGTLFLFCGRKTDRVKGLLFEGLSAGFCYPHISYHENRQYSTYTVFIMHEMCG